MNAIAAKISDSFLWLIFLCDDEQKKGSGGQVCRQSIIDRHCRRHNGRALHRYTSLKPQNFHFFFRRPRPHRRPARLVKDSWNFIARVVLLVANWQILQL